MSVSDVKDYLKGIVDLDITDISKDTGNALVVAIFAQQALAAKILLDLDKQGSPGGAGQPHHPAGGGGGVHMKEGDILVAKMSGRSRNDGE